MKKLHSLRQQNKRFCFLCFSPSMILTIIIIFIPVIYGMVLSFTDLNMIFPQWSWTGFSNYIEMINNPRTLASLRITLIWVIFTTAGAYFFGLISALLLNNDFFGCIVFKIIVFIPWVVPAVIAAYMWEWQYDPTYGGVNYILSLFTNGTVDIHWLSLKTALPAMINISIWRGIPFMAIMLLAALKTIPRELYDAARVDGANALQTFLNIILPSIKNVSLIAILLMTIWMFNHYDVPWVLSQGGPASSTMLLSIRTMRISIQEYRMGFGAAHGVLLMITISIVAIFYMKITMKNKIVE